MNSAVTERTVKPDSSGSNETKDLSLQPANDMPLTRSFDAVLKAHSIKQESDEDVIFKPQVRDKPTRQPVSARVKMLATKQMGQVRPVDDGNIEWYDPHRKEWSMLMSPADTFIIVLTLSGPAVYHTNIRRALLEEAATHGRYRKHDYHGFRSVLNDFHRLPNGSWQGGTGCCKLTRHLHGVQHNSDACQTAFHPLYANNGSKRENWPEILFQYQPTEADFKHPKPGLWIWRDGRVIIDLNDDAMLDYPEIPVTLARHADTWLLQTCMRLNNHISLQDFRGRMIGELKVIRADPMGRNRISMNMTRFRKFACCLTWNSIREVDYQRDYLDKKLPRRCIRSNSTESFRMLDSWEVAEMELQHAGKFLNRTRGMAKDKSEDRARTVYTRKKKEYKTLKAAFLRSNGGPRIDYDAEDEEYRKHLQQLVKNEPSGVKGEESDDEEMKTEDNEVPPMKMNSAKRISAIKAAYILPNTPPASPVFQREVSSSLKFQCPRQHAQITPFVTTAPNSVEDAQLVYDLLKPTRFHFEKMTGTKPPVTEADECYNCQFTDIDDALKEWHDEHKPLRGMRRGKLVGLDGIDEDYFYWNKKWVEAWYGPKVYLEDTRMQTDRIEEWGMQEGTDESELE